jgi:L-ascorbate metabolism protein UlaG (beta-lactamase superfamily)
MPIGQSLIDQINDVSVAQGQCAFWWLGQHSFVLKFGKSVIYVDPFLSNIEGRRIPPLVDASSITNADAILGSHDHVDHIDRGAWPTLAKSSPAAKFIVPILLKDRICEELGISPQRVLGVDDGISVGIGPVKITGVPAAHEFLDTDPKTGRHPFLGFVIEGNGVCVYHAGDTCIYEGMHAILKRWHFDLAFLPINGRSAKRLAAGIVGNMTYQEAADLAGTLRPSLVVPAHFDMFEANREDPQLFVDYVAVKYPSLATMIPKHGECVLAGRSGAAVSC